MRYTILEILLPWLSYSGWIGIGLLSLWQWRRTRQWHQRLRQAEADCQSWQEMAGRLRSMLDAVPLPIWHRTPNLTIDSCNRAFAEAVAHDPTELGLADTEVTPYKNQQRVLAHQLAKTHHPQSALFSAVIGHKRCMLQVEEVWHNNHHVGYALDQTAVQETQTLLQQQRDGQQTLLEALSSGIAVFDADKRLMFFNRAYVHLSGATESWLVSRPTMGEILEDLRARRRLPEYADFPAYKRKQLAQFTELQEPEEQLLYRPDGHTIRQVTVPNPMGGLICVFEDLTDRLTLEQQYNTLMAVQRHTFNHLYEGIVVLGSDHRVKLLNPALLKLWQLEEKTVEVGQHLSFFLEAIALHFEDKKDWQAYALKLTSILMERVTMGGRLHCQPNKMLDFKYVPLPDGAHLLTYIDVTDQQRVEAMLRDRNHALEEADSLKSQFIAHVSYALRTPLNTILGFTELLDQQYFGPLNSQQKGYTTGILSASQHLLTLINDLLDLATIESDHMELELEEIQLPQLLDAVRILVEKSVQQANLTLHLFYEDHLPGVLLDQRRIKHVLCHLINNAIKFTPPGGTITLGAQVQAQWLILWVRDTGVGIPERDQQRVWQKFEQAQPSPAQGTGIGLSLVKSFIELHGGHVHMESDPQQGTTLSCYLPLMGKGR